MPGNSAERSEALKREVLTLLAQNRIMCVATIRPDGWPQATMVGFIYEDLALYFAVARSSQKLSNIQRDPRVSIAIGRDTRRRLRGLSMAARVSEVTDPDEIARINTVLHDRYPEQAVFAPREASAALLKATPELISIVNRSKDGGRPRLISLERETVLRAMDRDAAGPTPPHGPPAYLG